MIYAIDFDGVLCEDKYPLIGEPIEWWIEFVKWHQKIGDKFILWTCRDGEKLEEARIWCKTQGLGFNAINNNLPENVAKYCNNSRKVFADCYIDDKNLKIVETPRGTYIAQELQNIKIIGIDLASGPDHTAFK